MLPERQCQCLAQAGEADLEQAGGTVGTRSQCLRDTGAEGLWGNYLCPVGKAGRRWVVHALVPKVNPWAVSSG